ncbi:MAG: KAP family P-loop NTPase fold protein [Streptosporangiaceae bacterium]
MSVTSAPDDPVPGMKILLDSPTKSPALGYHDIGHGLANLISESEPQFAVGIFGGWGTGKTTLMSAIKAALPTSRLVVVDFNAWRFEREPQLLIPLLDTIRAALIEWSDAYGAGTESKVRALAGRIGRVARALAAGLSAEVGLPGAVTVSYELGQAIDQLTAHSDPDQPQSLYVAAFRELATAFSALDAAPVARIVVFVDDLDRCLPTNALEVLESIKLFFDLPGFIFVVGLDEQVVVRAIRAKFAAQDEQAGSPEAGPAPSATAGRRLGREYVKKIFQLSYSLPAMLPGQLDELLQSMYREASLGPAQLADLESLVRPYLGYVAVDRRVNPREVKRFVNAYTLQALVRPDLRRDTILALQTLAFRDEWEGLYDALLTDTDMFAEILNRYRRDDGSEQAFADLAPGLGVLPPSLASYLRSALAAPLLAPEPLDPYVSSLQSTRGTPTWISETYKLIGQLRHRLRALLGDAAADQAHRAEIEAIVAEALRMAESLFATTSGPDAPSDNYRLQRVLDHVRHTAGRLASVADRRNPSDAIDLEAVLTDLLHAIDQLRDDLKAIRDFSILLP